MKKPEKRKRKTVAEFFRSIADFDNSAVYAINITSKFSKSVKRCHARNLNLELLENVIYTLAQGKQLDMKYHPHPLQGFKTRPDEKVMECHIQPDWLLVWTQNDIELILLLTDTGTHSDLF